ncbi:MAG: M61 family metallopeptidase [Acidobacteria bacterium]|nr:M61 family metallopeptidase [Acidobacteriota bacterium]
MSLLLVSCTFIWCNPAAATIRYSVSLSHPEDHKLHIEMIVPNASGELTVSMPAWNATYQIRDFAQYVQDVRAHDAKQASLSVRKIDKQSWRISGKGSVQIEYETTWDESSPFSAQLNSNHAFLNFAMILMYVPERRKEDVRIEFTNIPGEWHGAVPLKSGDTANSFVAPNYDALVDAPVEWGTFTESQIEVGGKTIRIVTHGTPPDRKALEEVLRKIVTYQTSLMHEAPYPEYMFLFHFGQGGGGGMEHANSTAIHTGGGFMPTGVSAHEFFHLWNVKRIRPQSLEPVDYSREMWTRALWFAEGVTSTYGSYTQVRTGLWSPKQFYDDLASQIRSLESRPARLWYSVEESSLDAWLEKYPFHNRPESSVNYYNKGQLVGVMLDILLRDSSDNRCSLDDVIRYLNEEYAHRGRFYDDSAGIQQAAEAILNRAHVKAQPSDAKTSLGSLEQFFKRFVAGTEEPPFREFLARAGLSLLVADRMQADLGFQTGRGPGAQPSISRVQSGSDAEKAGLREGDVLLQLAGAEPPRNLDAWVRAHQPGEVIDVRIRRGNEDLNLRFSLGQRGDWGFEIQEDTQATEKALRIRDGLLQGKTD